MRKHNENFGDEKIMEMLFKMGRLGEKISGARPEITKEELAKAAAKM